MPSAGTSLGTIPTAPLDICHVTDSADAVIDRQGFVVWGTEQHVEPRLLRSDRDRAPNRQRARQPSLLLRERMILMSTLAPRSRLLPPLFQWTA